MYSIPYQESHNARNSGNNHTVSNKAGKARGLHASFPVRHAEQMKAQDSQWDSQADMATARETPLCWGNRMLLRHTTQLSSALWYSVPHNSIFFIFVSLPLPLRLQRPHTSVHSTACSLSPAANTSIQNWSYPDTKHYTECVLVKNKSSGYMYQFWPLKDAAWEMTRVTLIRQY